MGTLTPQARFTQWVDTTRASYQNDPPKLEQFNRSLVYFNSLTRSYGDSAVVGRSPRISATIVYASAQSLTVSLIDTAGVMVIEGSKAGYFRQLIDFKNELLAETTSSTDPNYCGTCRKVHKKYGLELEVNAVSDHTYRDVLLRKLNGKLRLDPGSDDYGIDGSGVPLELRNINGSSIEDVITVLKDRLSKFNGALTWMQDGFPSMSAGMNTQGCGIHVHTFHKGVTPEKLATAHSLVGLLVNSRSRSDWDSRLPGYGGPFNFRDVSGNNGRGRWCTATRSATELRTFNVLSPEVLKWALERTEEIVAGDYNVAPTQFETHMRNDRHYTTSPVMNHALAFFKDQRVITAEKIEEMNSWLDANYLPFHAGQGRGNQERIEVADPARWEEARDERRAREVNPPERPSPQQINETIRQIWANPVNDAVMRNAEAITSTVARERARTRRGSWCTRIASMARTLGGFIGINARHFRNSLRRHLIACSVCRATHGDHMRRGYCIRTTGQIGNSPSGIGYFQRGGN